MCPPFGTAEYDRLRLLGLVLGGSQSSRLGKRLKFTEKLADSVSTFVFGQEIASLFIVQADVKAGVEPAKVEAAIDDEVAKLVVEGPTAEEVAQARAVVQAAFVRGIERIGGFGGKADVIAQCQVFTGNPGCFRATLANYESTTAAQLKAIGGKWLGRGVFTLQIDPASASLPSRSPLCPTSRPAWSRRRPRG